MRKITEKKYINTMILLCVFVYFVSYITRINYGAVILEIVLTEGILKSAASLALTGSYITYGTGQLIAGYLGDRIKPNILVFAGLLVSSVMNLLIPISSKVLYMIIVWCINGFAQAFIWPPLVKIMSYLFTDDIYKKACVRVSWGSSFGTIAVYLLAPVCIIISGWRSVFLISALSGFIMSIVWLTVYASIEKHVGNYDAYETYNAPDAYDALNESKFQSKSTVIKKHIPFRFILLLTGIMFAIILQGILRDGITTWMPTYISEIYNISSYISILTGVVLPIFSIICFQAALWLYESKLNNELICAGSIFGIGFLAAAILAAAPSFSPALSVALSTVITGCMHGVNLILICMIPLHFKKYNKVSFVSGLLNSCTYIGSSLSTYGTAKISEIFGWHLTVLSWSIIALAGTIICFSCANIWQRFCENN